MRASVMLAVLLSVTRVWATPDDTAQRAYAEGAAAYREGRYDRALERFQESLRISGRTALLYNIALCYEGLGAPSKAAEALRRYLRAEPSAPDRAPIEQHLRELDERARALAEGAVVAPAPSVVVAPRPERPRRPKVVWGFLAASGATLIAALSTGVAAHLDYLSLVDQCGGVHCTPAQGPLQDEGVRLATASDALLGVGAALAVGTVIAGVLEWRAARRPRPAP